MPRLVQTPMRTSRARFGMILPDTYEVETEDVPEEGNPGSDDTWNDLQSCFPLILLIVTAVRTIAFYPVVNG